MFIVRTVHSLHSTCNSSASIGCSCSQCSISNSLSLPSYYHGDGDYHGPLTGGEWSYTHYFIVASCTLVIIKE